MKTKKLLSVFMAIITCISFSNINVSAADQRIDRTGGRHDGTWLFPLAQSYYNQFTDWAGCITGYCRLCGGNHTTTDMGDKWHPNAQFKGVGHNGADIGAGVGTSVMASAGGVVRASGTYGERGLTVMIEHSIPGETNMSYYSYYQHLSSSSVSVGRQVNAGDVIGRVGNSGGNYGYHLHFGMVLAEKNCDIMNRLFSIECSGFLMKNDGYGKAGGILVNPSVRSVFPTGKINNSLGWHSGSVSYTFDKNQVSIGGAAQGSYETIPDGTYFIYNRSLNCAIGLSYNIDQNGQNIDVNSFEQWDGQKMNITACSSDKKTFKIRPISATRLVQMYGTIAAENKDVRLWEDLNNSTQWWKFKKVNGGYAIFIDCNHSFALTATGAGGNAQLNTYVGGSNQIWELIPYNQTYTVAYNANGGSGSMENSVFSVGKTEALRPNAFTRTGYTFLGWSTSASATTPAYTDKQSVSNLAASGAAITLYAVWKRQTYTIAYNANGGSGSMENSVMTCDKNEALSPNAFTRTDHTFLGWSMNASSSAAAYLDKQTVRNLATSGSTVTLYAIWKKNQTTAPPINPSASAIRIDNAAAVVGQQVKIPIYIDNAKLFGLEFSLKFDPQVLKFVSESESVFEQTMVNKANEEKGSISLFLVNTNTESSGKIITLTFDVLAKNPCSTTLRITDSTALDEKSEPISILEGQAEISVITAGKPGDINNDGKVNIIDALWTLQAAAGIRTLTDSQKMSADVNKDGKVNIIDALWVLQAAAGLRQL